MNHRINHIHEPVLRIAYKDNENLFGFLLEQSKSVQIHERNLQLLTTEIHKIECSPYPPFMKDVFVERNFSYSLRPGDDVQLQKVRATSFEVESMGSKQSNRLPILQRTNKLLK